VAVIKNLSRRKLFNGFFYSCMVHLDNIESLIYSTDAQVDCSKNSKIYITIYMRVAATCFGFSQPSSGSYYMCFGKVISINNQLKYVVYRISWSSGCIFIQSLLVRARARVCVCVCVCVCV